MQLVSKANYLLFFQNHVSKKSKPEKDKFYFFISSYKKGCRFLNLLNYDVVYDER